MIWTMNFHLELMRETLCRGSTLSSAISSIQGQPYRARQYGGVSMLGSRTRTASIGRIGRPPHESCPNAVIQFTDCLHWAGRTQATLSYLAGVCRYYSSGAELLQFRCTTNDLQRTVSFYTYRIIPGYVTFFICQAYIGFSVP